MYIPKFTITNKILKTVGEIEAAKEVVENAPLVPFYEKQFQTDAIERTVHHGTHIEGNELSFEQAKQVMEGETVMAHERDIQEVINYRNAMKLLDQLSEQTNDYSVETLLAIHKETVNKIIPEEKVGTLRTTQVVIREEGTGEVIFSPPPSVEVPYLLEDFFEWLNSPEAKEVHPVLRAGIAHYILVAIHPFVEGNGRTVRAFSNLIMVREQYDVKRFFSFEEHFDRDLSGYYEAFAQVDRQSKNIAARDLTFWLEYFSRVVAVELAKIKERVRKLSVDTKMKGRLGKQIALTDRQMRLIEYLSENNSAIMQDLKHLAPMVSEDTILRDLRDLMEKGIIAKEGSTKASRYVIANK